MRTIAVVNHVTLDGVMQSPASPDEDRRGGFEHGGWSVPYGDEVMAGVRAEHMADDGALLLGRRTYEKFAAFWPHQTDDNPFTLVLNAAGAGQGQDPRRRDPLPRPERSRPAGPPARRLGRALPDLQRGLRRQRGRRARARRPVRGGDPPEPPRRRADARPARGARAARADAAARGAGPRASPRTAPSCGWPTRIAPSGPRADRRRAGDRPPVPAPQRARAVPDPGGDQRRAQRRPDGAAATNWLQIVQLYEQLLALAPTPVVALNRAVAVAEVHGPEAALQLVDELDLGGYDLFHAVRADLLRRLSRDAEPRRAYEAAIALTDNAAEREFLRRRRDGG